jgi:hypothetical protein
MRFSARVVRLIETFPLYGELPGTASGKLPADSRDRNGPASGGGAGARSGSGQRRRAGGPDARRAGGDASIRLVDEVAAFQNALGVYLIAPDGTIHDPTIAFARIEAAAADPRFPYARPGGGPLAAGDGVALSQLYDAAQLVPGTRFGLFVIADGRRAGARSGGPPRWLRRARAGRSRERPAGQHLRPGAGPRAAPHRGRRPCRVPGRASRRTKSPARAAGRSPVMRRRATGPRAGPDARRSRR